VADIFASSSDPRHTLAVLAILQPDVRVAARLSEALAGAHEVVLPGDWAELYNLIERGEVEACLVDADHPDRDQASVQIAELTRRFPDSGVVACVDSDVPEGYFDLGALGVDGVVVAGSLPSRVRADVDRALSTCRAEWVERSLEGRVPAPGPSVIAWAMEHAGPDTTVERFAGAQGLTPAALRDALQRAGLPTPGRVLLWGRLILAGARLGDDGRRAEDVAFSLGYATTTSLARAMKVHTGLTPAEVSQKGGIRVVLNALLHQTAVAGPRGGGRPRATPMSRLATLPAALLMAGCASMGLGGASVDRDSIEETLNTAPMDQLHFGVLAVDAASGRTLYSYNAQRRFIPASNQKILVTAVALSLLGPDYRFRTEVRTRGSIDGSFLNGDLIFVASGDPSLSDRYWPSGTAALEALADSVAGAGITHVAGSAWVDVSAWDSTTVGPTWEVEDLRYAYGSTGGAFAIDEGEIEVVVTGGASPGEPARVQWTPLGTSDFVQSELITSAPDSSTRVRPHYLPESRRLVLKGTVESGQTDTLSFAMRDPVRQAAAALSNAMDRAGIEVEGGLSVRWPENDPTRSHCSRAPSRGCSETDLIAVLESPPLSELVAGILEPSQNWMTEQLVRALGARYGDEGSWNEGLDVVQHFLINEMGVEPLDISAHDGSGLSFYNLVTPRALVRILREMQQGGSAAEYRMAMAEPGEVDSTLENRLAGLEGRVFAKTGTISNVNSLSGYLVRDDGQEVVFSILANATGMPASQLRIAIDEIVRGLAR
jgi:D-alanyl-D-alanine carboxypeptidase/D-alanyl-D-alanine-endopeptidase (penicillin-binding protein 4)